MHRTMIPIHFILNRHSVAAINYTREGKARTLYLKRTAHLRLPLQDLPGEGLTSAMSVEDATIGLAVLLILTADDGAAVDCGLGCPIRVDRIETGLSGRAREEAVDADDDGTAALTGSELDGRAAGALDDGAGLGLSPTKMSFCAPGMNPTSAL